MAVFSAALVAGLFWLEGAPMAPASASAACIVEEARCFCVTTTSRDPAVRHDDRVERAELIVRARVVALDTLGTLSPDSILGGSLGYPIVARLAVDELWKGSVEDGTFELFLTHTRARRGCELWYPPGEEILLYARWNPNTERWSSSICSGTTTVARAQERGDLERLGPGLRPGD